jgi:hypothetical protein
MRFLLLALSSALLEMVHEPSSTRSSHLIVGQGRFGPEETVGFCGADARVERILAYFDGIRRDVSAGQIESFDKYYAGSVTIGFHRKTHTLSGSRLARSRTLRLTLRDWKLIGQLSATQLGSGGWRGCFVSTGKAFFSVQQDGQLKLVAFDKDRPWELR